jgi:hypothetical protein
MEKRDYYAKLVIYGLPDIKTVRRSRLLNWLEHIRKDLIKEDQKKFSKVYTLKLMK